MSSQLRHARKHCRRVFKMIFYKVFLNFCTFEDIFGEAQAQFFRFLLRCARVLWVFKKKFCTFFKKFAGGLVFWGLKNFRTFLRNSTPLAPLRSATRARVFLRVPRASSDRRTLVSLDERAARDLNSRAPPLKLP